MSTLLETLQSGKLHWLTVPRYAVIALPSALAGALGLAGWGGLAWLPMLVAALGVARLVWFPHLPHEKARLAAARAALADARPELAMAQLQRPLAFVAYPAHPAVVSAALREAPPSAPGGHLHPEPPAAQRAPAAPLQGAHPCTG